MTDVKAITPDERIEICSWAEGVVEFTYNPGDDSNHTLNDAIRFLSYNAALLSKKKALTETEDKLKAAEEALEHIQSAQTTNHGCMSAILIDISKIASSALAVIRGEK